jgi:hypothetical protein
MLLGGFVGRTLWLLPLGILLAIGAVVSTVFPTIPRNFADVNYLAPEGQTITTRTDTFDIGSVHLDLTQATFGPDAKVEVHGGVGEIVVMVPNDVDVHGQLTAELLGEVDGPSHQPNNHQEGHKAKLSLDDRGIGDVAKRESVTLELDLRVGSIRVERG